VLRIGTLLIPVSHADRILSPHLEGLIARLIRTYAARTIATFRAENDTLPANLGDFIPLRPVQGKADVLVTADIAGLADAVSASKAATVIAVSYRKSDDDRLRRFMASSQHYELREMFHFGAFALPLALFCFLPGVKSLMRLFFAAEVKLHPYLNLLLGLGTVCVLQARRRDTGKELDLACVIPAYNEAARLPAYLPSVIKYFRARKVKFEILVVDDGSRDNTAAVISKQFPQVKTLRLYENSGKGAAVREGVMAAVAKQILVCDADGATPIEELTKLETALTGGADVAIGSRYLAESDIGVKQSFIRRLVSRAGNLLIRALLDLPYRDTQCGFKLFERRAGQYVFRNLANLRFGFDFEVLKKAALLNLSVAEVPVRWNDQAGSKVTFKQTIRVLNELLRFRFGHLFKFAVVGTLNTLTDFTVHNGLILAFGVGGQARQLIYMVAAFLCANLVAFTLHSGYTFQRRAAYRRFFTVSAFTLVLSALIFHGLNLLYNRENAVLLTNLFKLSTVLISLVTNYFGYKFWVYRFPI